MLDESINEQTNVLLARIDERQRQFSALFTQVQAQISNLQSVTTNVQSTLSKMEGQNISNRVAKLEDKTASLESSWMWARGIMAILGAVLLALLGVVIKRLFG